MDGYDGIYLLLKYDFCYFLVIFRRKRDKFHLSRTDFALFSLEFMAIYNCY